jgi:hypothetical protein
VNNFSKIFRGSVCGKGVENLCAEVKKIIAARKWARGDCAAAQQFV